MNTAETLTTTQVMDSVDDIWNIIQRQSVDVRHAIFLKMKEDYKKSMAESESILQKLNELEEGPVGFLQLDGILPPSIQSVEELREDAYMEKYGI